MKTLTEPQKEAAWKILTDAAMPLLDRNFKQITEPKIVARPDIDAETLDAGYAAAPADEYCGKVLMVVISIGAPHGELITRASFSQGYQCCCGENPEMLFSPIVVRLAFDKGLTVVQYLDDNYADYYRR